MSSVRKVSLEYLKESDPSALGDIHTILKTYGITEEAYAMIFERVYGEGPDDVEKISYMKSQNQWCQGNTTLSDAKILVALSRVCELIHDFVMEAWNESIFANWIPQKELRRILDVMDKMESLDKLKIILDKASAAMVDTSAKPGQFIWESADAED